MLAVNLYKSTIYSSDLNTAINSNPKILEKLRGMKIFITGATGLIGSSVIDILLRYNEMFNGKICIYASTHDQEHTKQRFGHCINQDMIQFIPYNSGGHNVLNFQTDYVIHGAGNAYPGIIQRHSSETLLNTIMSTHELLDYMVKYRGKKMVFISSSEIYGIRMSSEAHCENDYGVIDILNPRSSYAVGKQAAETLCVSYWHERKTPVSIVRPGHIYGPTASEQDNRVSSAFAYDAVQGKGLVLKSDGSQLRSYCYMLDCAMAILTTLVEGEEGEAYNISNPNSIVTIRQLAEAYAREGGVSLNFEAPSKAEKGAFNPMMNSSLNSDKLYHIGWRAVFDFSIGIAHTIQIMREALI